MDTIVKQCYEKLVNEYKKPENKKILEEEFLDPIIKYIGNQLWPYILSLSILFSVIFIMLVYILFVTRKAIKLNSM